MRVEYFFIDTLNIFFDLSPGGARPMAARTKTAVSGQALRDPKGCRGPSAVVAQPLGPMAKRGSL